MVTTRVIDDDDDDDDDEEEANPDASTEEAFHKAILWAPIEVPFASSRPVKPTPSRTSHARTRSPVESSSALCGQHPDTQQTHMSAAGQYLATAIGRARTHSQTRSISAVVVPAGRVRASVLEGGRVQGAALVGVAAGVP